MVRPVTKGPPRCARLPLETDERLVELADNDGVPVGVMIETILEAALWDEAWMSKLV